MSILPENMKVEYKAVRVKVVRKSTTTPGAWYNKHVGEIFRAIQKTWFEDSVIKNISYEVKRTPDGGYNRYLGKEDIEVL